MRPSLSQAEFEHLLRLRTGLRRFLRWSEREAGAAGVTPAHQQLLLAIKGHFDPAGPTVGEIAGYLLVRHHTAVSLIDRASAAGLVKRTPDPANSRIVRVSLTEHGSERLNALTDQHHEELEHLAPTMQALWRALDRAAGDAAHPAAPPQPRDGG